MKPTYQADDQMFSELTKMPVAQPQHSYKQNLYTKQNSYAKKAHKQTSYITPPPQPSVFHDSEIISTGPSCIPKSKPYPKSQSKPTAPFKATTKPQMKQECPFEDDDILSKGPSQIAPVYKKQQKSGSNSKLPFNSQPFAFKNDPKYKEEKIKKMEEIHDKVIKEEIHKQSNNFFTPFQHKLGGDFTPNQEAVLARERRKYRQKMRNFQDTVNSQRSYTIMFVNDKKQTPVLQMAGGMMSHNPLNPLASNPYEYPPGFKDPFAKQKCTQDTPLITKPRNSFHQQLANATRPASKQKKVHYVAPDFYSQITQQPGLQEIDPTPVPKQLPKQIPKPAAKPKLPPKPKVPKVQRKQGIKQNKVDEGGKVFEKGSFANQSTSKEIGLIEILENEVVEKNLAVKFEDIAGLETAKELLQEAVLLPLIMPQYFQGIRRPWKGILLFGPPGTGKTLLAKAVASTGKSTFFNVSASTLASKFKGDSQKMVRLLFEMARFYAPSTIFFDEIDALGSKRSTDQCESNRKVKTQLLCQMDGATENNQNVIVIAATNRPWDLDEALRRRLQKRVYIPLPCRKGRQQLFHLNLKGIMLSEDIIYSKLISKTDGYSGADLNLICRQAAMLPMRRRLREIGGVDKVSDISLLKQQLNVALDMGVFEEAINKVNPSVGGQDLDRYEAWMKEFGSI